MNQLLLFQELHHISQNHWNNKVPCRLCLGKTPPPINPCRCSSGFIHEKCLKIQISKQLKYHNNPIITCQECLKLIDYRLKRQYRVRNLRQLKQFLYMNILPEFIMILLILIGLALNQNCLNKVKAQTFWMKVIKVYLVLVGVYLQLLLIFVVWIMFEGCKQQFLVRDLQPENIIIF